MSKPIPRPHPRLWIPSLAHTSVTLSPNVIASSISPLNWLLSAPSPSPCVPTAVFLFPSPSFKCFLVLCPLLPPSHSQSDCSRSARSLSLLHGPMELLSSWLLSSILVAMFCEPCAVLCRGLCEAPVQLGLEMTSSFVSSFLSSASHTLCFLCLYLRTWFP